MQIGIGGGMGEEYMSAPRLNVGGGSGGKGGGGLIASVLDLLGVGRQVAKDPKKKVKDKPVQKKPGQGSSPAGKVTATGGAPAFTPMMGAQTSIPAAAPPPAMGILDAATAAFQPQASKLGFANLPTVLTPPGSSISPENLKRHGYTRY